MPPARVTNGLVEVDGVALTALAVDDYGGVGVDREPVLPVVAPAALVLVEAAYPARELVLVEQDAAGVHLQDHDQGLDGGVVGVDPLHRGLCGRGRLGLALLAGPLACGLPLAELALRTPPSWP